MPQAHGHQGTRRVLSLCGPLLSALPLDCGPHCRNAPGEDFQRIIGFLEARTIDLAPRIIHCATVNTTIDVFHTGLSRAAG